MKAAAILAALVLPALAPSAVAEEVGQYAAVVLPPLRHKRSHCLHEEWIRVGMERGVGCEFYGCSEYSSQTIRHVQPAQTLSAPSFRLRDREEDS